MLMNNNGDITKIHSNNMMWCWWLKIQKRTGNNNARRIIIHKGGGESEDDVDGAVGKIFWLNCHCQENWPIDPWWFHGKEIRMVVKLVMERLLPEKIFFKLAIKWRIASPLSSTCLFQTPFFTADNFRGVYPNSRSATIFKWNSVK